jgi:SagB-type dehydrogenase family enzyme
MLEEHQVDGSLAGAAMFANNFRPCDPWVDATGLRTHAARHRALGHSNDHRLADDFLVNSRLRRDDPEGNLSIESYFADPAVVMLSLQGREEQPGFRRIALPDGPRPRMELADAVVRRRSLRQYTGDPMGLPYLATVLRQAAGVTGHANATLLDGNARTFHFRAASSAGGLYPIDLHVAAIRVNGLERGRYRYDPLGDELWQTGPSADVERLLECFAAPEEMISVSQAAAIFLLVAEPWKAMRKYGDRGMRNVFIEAGSIAGHVNLSAVALGFGTVECAGVYDDEVHEVLGVDGLYQALVHTVIVGVPA